MSILFYIIKTSMSIEKKGDGSDHPDYIPAVILYVKPHVKAGKVPVIKRYNTMNHWIA